MVWQLGPMFNKISSLILSVLFFFVLLGSAADFYVFVASVLIFAAATFAVNIKKTGWSWSHLLLPGLFILGVACIFVVITSPTLRIIFLLVSSLMFYILENQLGRESHFLQNIYLFSVFAILVGVYAFHFYFHFAFYWLVLMVFIATYLFIVQGFAGFSLPAKKYFYFLTALVCAEVAWGLSLWPTYFLVNAVVTFCIYYILWLFAFSTFFGKLTASKIYLQLTLVIIVLALTLSSAAWRPLFN